MKKKETAITLTDTSPAAASTVVSTAIVFKGDLCTRADLLILDAKIIGGTGGTLDVYLQRKLAADAWTDWVHFPQVAAGTTKRFTVACNGEGASITDTGAGTDATPSVTIAANTAINIVPGGDIRAVFVAGASTSAGAATTITITPYSKRS